MHCDFIKASILITYNSMKQISNWVLLYFAVILKTYLTKSLTINYSHCFADAYFTKFHSQAFDKTITLHHKTNWRPYRLPD